VTKLKITIQTSNAPRRMPEGRLVADRSSLRSATDRLAVPLATWIRQTSILLPVLYIHKRAIFWFSVLCFDTLLL